MFNDINTTDYKEGECVIATPETCFVVEDTSIAVSYEIGDNCENYFVNNNDWWSQEDVTNYCNGTNSYGYNLKADILNEDLDIEELKTNNVIKNVVMKDGLSIKGYDINACGVDVVIPSKINNKEVVAIGDRAFREALMPLFIPNDKNNIQFMNSKVELAIVDRSDIKSVIIPSTVNI